VPNVAHCWSSISKPTFEPTPYLYRYRTFPHYFTIALPTLLQIVDAFRLPRAYTNLIASHNTGVFELHSSERGVQSSDNKQPKAEEEVSGVFAFLGGISLAINFDSASQTTYAIVIGLCEHQNAKLVETIRACASELVLPMSLALMWLNVLGELRARRVTYRKDAIVRTELSIGTHWSRDGRTAAEQLTNLDFDDLSRRLTVLGSETAWDLHAIETQFEMVDAFEEIQDGLNESVRQVSPAAKLAFQHRSKYARQLLKGLRGWTMYTQSRVQIQLQTVSNFFLR
jgi:hypothetical protein